MKRIVTTLAALLLASVAPAQLLCGSSLSAASCGPQLTITFTPNGEAGNYDFVMTGTGLHPQSAGAFSWGFHPINVPLPGGCPLLTDYVWGHAFMTDSSGTASWSRSWPHWATIQFYMQMGSVQVGPSGLTALSTDCYLTGCQ